MTIAVLTWPEAVVGATSIAAIALMLSILIWSIFRTGQTAIKHEDGQSRLIEGLRVEVDELRAQLQQSTPPSQGETRA